MRLEHLTSVTKNKMIENKCDQRQGGSDAHQVDHPIR